MTSQTETGTQNATGRTAEPKKTETMSDYLPQAARTLRDAGIELVLMEYEAGKAHIIALGTKRETFSSKPAKLVAIEIVQHLSLILRRRYPGYFEGDGSKGVFEWDLRTDTLKQEHTRVHYGMQ